MHESATGPRQPAPRIPAFNYQVLAEDDRRPVREATAAIRRLVRNTVANTIEIGLRLKEVRKAIGLEYFAEYLEKEYPWSVSHAYNCIRVEIVYRDLDVELHDRFHPSALIVLAQCNVPEAARDTALQLARAGRVVTKKAAQQLVAQYTGRPIPVPDRVMEQLYGALHQIDEHGNRLTATQRLRASRRLSDTLCRLNSRACVGDELKDVMSDSTLDFAANAGNADIAASVLPTDDDGRSAIETGFILPRKNGPLSISNMFQAPNEQQAVKTDRH